MGTRGFDHESTHRRHGSHRRPRGAEEARTNNREFDNGGMADFMDSLEGMKLGSRHHSTRVRFEDSQGGTNHRDSSVGDKEGRHARYPHGEHRHKENRHGEHQHGGHRHGEHRHGKHRHGDHQQMGHRHEENRHGEHRHEKHGHGEHRHKEHLQQEHRHGEHRSKEQEFNKKMYESALLHFRENSGSPYPCKQSEIDFHYRGVFDKPNKGPFVTAMQATEEVMRWNDEKRAPPREELDIIRALTIAVHDAEKNLRFGPDLMIKTFADLDRVFFCGRLRGHVIVRWVKRIKSAFGVTHYPRRGQCFIDLNAEMILLRKWREGSNPVTSMFSTLLHEMCHAYEFVRCHSREFDTGDGHGKHFGTKIGVVHDRAIRIIGTLAIERWEPYKQHHFLEGEKSRKVGISGGQDGGKKIGAGEIKLTGTGSGGQNWGTRKGTTCVVM